MKDQRFNYTFLFYFTISLILIQVGCENDSPSEPEVPDLTGAQYIGVAQCVICHRTEAQGRQEAIWRESLHSYAFERLKEPQSVSIAGNMGINQPPHEATECLVCHATGWDLPPQRLGDRFNIEDGVQCETCHGAGSEYRAIHGRDLEAGIERGLIVGRGDADRCIACHNENSPTYKGFDFERDMQAIAHPVP